MRLSSPGPDPSILIVDIETLAGLAGAGPWPLAMAAVGYRGNHSRAFPTPAQGHPDQPDFQ